MIDCWVPLPHQRDARWVKAQLPMPFEAEERGEFTRFTAVTSGLLALARLVVGLGGSARVETAELRALVRQLAQGALGDHGVSDSRTGQQY